jgi:zinc protease
MRFKAATAVLFGAVLSTTLVGQQKQAPPEGAPPKPFRAPVRDTSTLSNGFRITSARYGLIPKINVELIIRGGYVSEPQAKQGVSLLLGELMKEGTETRSAEQVAQEAASIGGVIDVRVGPDQIAVHGEALSDGAAKLVDLLADVALHPKLPESELARLKKDQLRNIAISKSTPRIMAAQEFLKIVYGDTGYGHAVPDEKTLEAVTIADIKAYYSQYFVPTNAILYLTGVFDPSLRKTIQQSFDNWAKAPAPSVPDVKARTVHTLQVVDRPGASQSTLYLGVPVIMPNNRDYIPLEVADSILGGSFMSRIVTNIREQKGYTYSPYSQIEMNADNGVWAQHADVTTKYTGASLTEIFGEIDKLRKQPPPEEELRGIQNGMAGIFVLRNSSRQGIINILKFVDLHRLPSNYVDNYIPTVFAVKPPEVQGMMEKYIDPKKMTIVVVGDKTQIDSQLAPFKPSS